MTSELDVNNIEFGSLNTYAYSIGGVSKEGKSVPISYRTEDGVRLNRFKICVRNCILKKVHAPKSGTDGYSLFVSCEDKDFVNFITGVEEKLPSIVEENSVDWYDEEFALEDCQTMFKSMLVNNDLGVSFSSPCDRRNFKFEFITDAPEGLDLTGPLEDVLLKNYRLDLCIEIRQLSLGIQNYTIKSAIHLANVVALSTPKKQGALTTAENFNSELVSLTPVENTTNPVTNMSQKTCKISYNGNPYFNFKLENVNGRMFKRTDDNGKVSYSIGVRMDDSHKEAFTLLSGSVFNVLKKKAKEYYGKPMTAAILKKTYSGYPSYGKEDKELIKAGEEPKYQPTLWIKVYYNPNNGGLNNKFMNSSNNEVITDPDTLCDTDLTFKELTIYNKHIWFGANTSTNFTVSDALVDFEVESYDMDSKPLVSVGTSGSTEDNTVSDSSDDDEDN
jgi:hypothetical protein